MNGAKSFPNAPHLNTTTNKRLNKTKATPNANDIFKYFPLSRPILISTNISVQRPVIGKENTVNAAYGLNGMVLSVLNKDTYANSPQKHKTETNPEK